MRSRFMFLGIGLVALTVVMERAWSAAAKSAGDRTGPKEAQTVPTVASTRDAITRSPARYGEVHVRTQPLEGGAVVQGPTETVAGRDGGSAATSIIIRGRFTSVQVNVNAGGNDVLNDAANEPSIAVDPTNPNLMAIGWRQFNTINNNFRQAGRAYTTNAGATWTFPGVLDPGQFRSDPVLGSDSTGRFYYSSLSSTTSVEMFRSLDGGVTWPQETPAFGGDKQWMTIDRSGGVGDGNVYQIWNVQFSCCGNADFTRSVDGGASFQGPWAIPQPSMKWGTMDVGPDGTLFLAGSTLGQDGHVFARSRNAKNAAATPVFDVVSNFDLGGFTGGFSSGSPNPGGLLGQVWIVTDHSNTTRRGNLYVFGSVLPAVGSDPHDIHFIRSSNNGATWSAPVRVDNDPLATNAYQWFGAISVAPNGRIDVTWNDTRNDANPPAPTFSELFYTFSLDGGVTWAPSEPASPAFNSFIGWPQQNKIGDYTHMWSDNGGARLAYAATFNGGQDVYFVRLTPDCNGNSIADETDIANLTSVDCNGNLTPDECEPFVDCNSNTVNDICDVGAGTSDDCNENQVPDECESAADCNANLIPDICELFSGGGDCDHNGILDECEAPMDCNNNGVKDACDLTEGTSQDCNENGVPDECDISSGTSEDVNGDGIPDECLGACCRCGICTDEIAADCAGILGAFYGGGTNCATTICSNPDACANAQVLPSEENVVAPFSNVCATNDGPASVPCDAGSQPFGTDLWFQYTAPCCGNATFSLCGDTNFDTLLAVYGGQAACSCPANNSGLLSCADDTCGFGGGPSILTIPVTRDRCYTVRVGGWNGEVGSGELTVSVACDPLPCGLADAPTSEPGGVAKNRYLSVVAPNPGLQTALRVTLLGMPAPFGAFTGQVRWVGAPVNHSETPAPPTTFKAAPLVCNPVYRNWGSDGLIHIYGDAIVPGGLYRVDTIRQGCDTANGCAFSSFLDFATAKWADVDVPFAPAGAQPDFADLSAIVDKFQQDPGAIITARADIQPDTPDRRVDFLDISRAVAAFQGAVYPFNGPSTCP